jgi:hypothetical protein
LYQPTVVASPISSPVDADQPEVATPTRRSWFSWS